MIPLIIEDLIKDLEMVEITDFHRSGDLVFSIGNKYILKVSEELARLQQEFEKDTWVSNHIKSGKPMVFIIENNKAYYLREYLEGDNLCSQEYLSKPEKLINLLVEGLNLIHNTKVNSKEYIVDEAYETLIHGDYCLPNILVKNGHVSGFVDLGDAGIGDPWCDYAWCIWSLEYNLKTKEYTPLLLEKLGIEFDEEKFNKYTK